MSYVDSVRGLPRLRALHNSLDACRTGIVTNRRDGLFVLRVRSSVRPQLISRPVSEASLNFKLHPFRFAFFTINGFPRRVLTPGDVSTLPVDSRVALVASSLEKFILCLRRLLQMLISMREL